MYGRTIVLSVPSDLAPSLGKLNSLLPSIGYAVGNSCGKSLAKSLELEELMADFYSGSGFHD